MEAGDGDSSILVSSDERHHVTFVDDYRRRRNPSVQGPARDGGWGWSIALAAFMSNMVISGIGHSFPILLQFLPKTFSEANSSSLMWIGSVQLGMYYLIGPFVAAATNKFGCRKVAIFGSVVATAGFLVSTRAKTPLVMTLTYGLTVGIGFGLIYLPSIVIVGNWFDKRRSFAIGLTVCGSGVGSIIMPRLTNHLYTEYSWPGGLILIAGIVFHCAFFGSIFRPVQPLKSHRQQGLMHRGSIMTALIAKKKQDRTTSSGSLDNCIITCDNKIIAYEQPVKKPNGLFPLIRSLGSGNMALSKKITLNSIVRQGTVVQLKPGQSKCKPAIPDTKSLLPPETLLIQSCGEIGKNKNAVFNVTETLSKSQSSHDLDRDSRLTDKDAAGDCGHQLAVSCDSHTAHANDAGYYSIPISRCSSSSSLRHRLTRSSHGLDSNKIIPAALAGSSLNSMPHYSYSDESYYVRDSSVSLFSHLKEILNDYFGADLLSSYTMWLAIAAFSMSSFGYAAPMYFLPMVAVDKLDDQTSIPDASFLLAIMGVSDTVGRLVSGWLGDRLWMDALHLSNTCLVLAGLFTCFMPCFAENYSTMAAFAACFGLSISVSITMRPIILVDLFGIGRLSSSFGILIFFLGLISIVSAPILAKVMELKSDLCPAFYVSGAFMIIGGLLGYPLRIVRDWEENRNQVVRMTVEEVEEVPLNEATNWKQEASNFAESENSL